MKRFNPQEGLPKGIEMVLIPRSQFEKLFVQHSVVKLTKEEVDIRDLVSSLGVEVWRLEKRLGLAKDGAGKVENSSVLDQLQRMKDIFKKQEIEIREYTGSFYNDGLSLKVLHVEEIDNVPAGKMQIIETIKPSVYFKGQVIFHGEVIVGKSRENKKEPENG